MDGHRQKLEVRVCALIAHRRAPTCQCLDCRERTEPICELHARTVFQPNWDERRTHARNDSEGMTVINSQAHRRRMARMPQCDLRTEVRTRFIGSNTIDWRGVLETSLHMLHTRHIWLHTDRIYHAKTELLSCAPRSAPATCPPLSLQSRRVACGCPLEWSLPAPV